MASIEEKHVPTKQEKRTQKFDVIIQALHEIVESGEVEANSIIEKKSNESYTGANPHVLKTIVKKLKKVEDRLSKMVHTKKKPQVDRKPRSSGLGAPHKLFTKYIQFFEKYLPVAARTPEFTQEHKISRIQCSKAVHEYIKMEKVPHSFITKQVDGKDVQEEEKKFFVPDKTLRDILQLGDKQKITRCEFNKHFSHLFDEPPKDESQKNKKQRKSKTEDSVTVPPTSQPSLPAPTLPTIPSSASSPVPTPVSNPVPPAPVPATSPAPVPTPAPAKEETKQRKKGVKKSE